MARTLLIVVGLALALRPAVAAACGNEIHLTSDELVQLIVKVEASLEAGRYYEAKRLLYSFRFPTPALQRRADDARALIQLRVPERAQDREDAARYFAARSSALGAKDVRFRAWLAEAYVATGKLDAARAILTDLAARDLMPDAVAYLALAKVSSGDERAQAFEACLARARNKRMCELPATRR